PLPKHRVLLPFPTRRSSDLGRAITANGPVGTAPVRLGTVRFGDFTDTNVPANVTDGQLGQSLLGMAYLDSFSAIEISGDRMTLRDRKSTRLNSSHVKISYAV